MEQSYAVSHDLHLDSTQLASLDYLQYLPEFPDIPLYTFHPLVSQQESHESHQRYLYSLKLLSCDGIFQELAVLHLILITVSFLSSLLNLETDHIFYIVQQNHYVLLYQKYHINYRYIHLISFPGILHYLVIIQILDLHA